MKKDNKIPGVHPDRIKDDHYKYLEDTNERATELMTKKGYLTRHMYFASHGMVKSIDGTANQVFVDNTPIIHLSIKSVYGRRLIYPMCEKSKIFSEICRFKSPLDTKTIPFEVIPMIENLGYFINIEGSTINDMDKIKELRMKYE